MGGSMRVDGFYRAFLAPGTAHCGLNGQAVKALTDWVEQGKAPDPLSATLTNASGQTHTRDLCRYPLVSRYNGDGDLAAAGSYRCAPAARG